MLEVMVQVLNQVMLLLQVAAVVPVLLEVMQVL
jgi:hypothetical protein